MPSEAHSARQLHRPPRPGAGDGTEIGGAERGTGNVEIGMIQNIVELAARLYIGDFDPGTLLP